MSITTTRLAPLLAARIRLKEQREHFKNIASGAMAEYLAVY